MALTQKDQIGRMQGWLTEWNVPTNSTARPMAWLPNGESMMNGNLMPGMATRDEITQLQNATGEQVDIPAGVVYDEGRATLTFIPGEAVGFDEFPVGNHTVGVIFWKLEDEVDGQQPSRVQSYNWTFNIV